MKNLIFLIVLCSSFSIFAQERFCLNVEKVHMIQGTPTLESSYENWDDTSRGWVKRKVFSQNQDLYKSILSYSPVNLISLPPGSDLSSLKLKYCLLPTEFLLTPDSENNLWLSGLTLNSYITIGQERSEVFRGYLKRAYKTYSAPVHLTVHLDLTLRGDYMDIDDKYPWVCDEDYNSCRLVITFPLEKLPYSESFGGTDLRIEPSGRVNFGFEYGDYDMSAKTSGIIPKSQGRFIHTDSPFELYLDGGEHASGYWGIDGVLRVTPTQSYYQY